MKKILLAACLLIFIAGGIFAVKDYWEYRGLHPKEEPQERVYQERVCLEDILSPAIELSSIEVDEDYLITINEFRVNLNMYRYRYDKGGWAVFERVR